MSFIFRCVMAAASTLALTQCSNTTLTDVGLKHGVVDVTTYHYDNARSGIQSHESVLTPANVNASSFGKLFTWPVDGQVYAHPLVAGNVIIPSDGLAHTLVLIATEHDSVYAFDADTLSATPVWMKSLLQTGESTLSVADVGRGDIQPEIGITGTPVIDPDQQILYVVTRSKSMTGSQTTYIERIHALSLRTGDEVLNGPVTISPSVSGNAPDAVNGQVPFNAQRQGQRAALALIGGKVWIGFASIGDIDPYHGWLLGYDASDLSKAPSIFLDTPNGSRGGIWMASGGPSSDATGSIYLASGNGDFDPSNGNYSSSALRLTATATGEVHVTDSYTPDNQAALSAVDADFGVMNPLILPDQTGPHPHLLVTADKNGDIFLLDRDQLGGYQKNGAVQVLGIGIGLHQNAIFFNNTLYVGLDKYPLAAYTFMATTGQFAPFPTSLSQEIFDCTDPCYVSGSAPSISANGTTDAILWVSQSGNYASLPPAILRAYDPADLSHELYNSTQAANNRDQASGAIKFMTPVVANGKVFLGGSGGVDVYGLLPK